MTNSWTDIKNTDLVVIMGGNAAEAHPCGFKWVTEAKANRGARLIVVDPRFTRSASVADVYAPIRQGTDIAFLLGVINYCMQNDKVQWDYVKAFTNASYIVKDGFAYKDGLFTGYDEAKRDYDKSTWDYVIGDDGYAVVDDTLTNPRCVWNLLKEHVSVYTPDMVERICGTPKDKFLQGRRDDLGVLVADQDHDLDVCARLDAALQGLAEHPLHGDAAAHPRQYRRARRRHECASRPFQHPGPDRYRADVEPAARLHEHADRQGGGLRHLHVDACLQAAAAQPDELLAELQEVLRQLPEGDVGPCGNAGERLRL